MQQAISSANLVHVSRVAGFGKHLLELIDDSPVTPGESRPGYDGYEASKAIIQDCEDALTNWVQSKSVVRSNLSMRTRSLSQRRKEKREGVDLSNQDQPMERDHDGWVPASQHGEYEAEEDEDEEEVANGDNRGRAEDAHDA